MNEEDLAPIGTKLHPETAPFLHGGKNKLRISLAHPFFKLKVYFSELVNGLNF